MAGERLISFLTASLVLLAATTLEAEAGAVETVRDALAGPAAALSERLDLDPVLEERLKPEVWRDLTEEQRGLLRAAARQRFLGMLAPPGSAGHEVAWAVALPPAPGGDTDVLAGLRVSGRTLKTRWRLRMAGGRWRVRDVLLSDPGISLARAAIESFGTQPLAVRRGWRQARVEVLPPLAALVVIALVVGLAAGRLSPSRRRALYLAALLPGLGFLALGIAGAGRVLRHPYSLEPPASGEPWRQSEELALRAEREGRDEEARVLRERALSAGAPAGPIAYERGLAARDRKDAEAARKLFQSALEAVPPAPGAAKELAALAVGQGDLAEAERQIIRYLKEAGPDPEALSLAAVIETDLKKSGEAVAYIAQARQLAGAGSRGAELEAQIRARAGDAKGVVDVLRPLAVEGRVDRSVLRADPAYLPIATDPAWVAFLNEK